MTVPPTAAKIDGKSPRSNMAPSTFVHLTASGKTVLQSMHGVPEESHVGT